MNQMQFFLHEYYRIQLPENTSFKALCFCENPPNQKRTKSALRKIFIIQGESFIKDKKLNRISSIRKIHKFSLNCRLVNCNSMAKLLKMGYYGKAHVYFHENKDEYCFTVILRCFCLQ